MPFANEEKADRRTCSVLDALAIGQAVRRGEAVLLEPVIFHREALTATVLFRPLRGTAEETLAKNRQKLECTLRKLMKEMEQHPLDGMTEVEVDHLFEKYSRYK
ncbi:MAG: hypothetical protein IKJ26_08235 [Clostridia bacterium]|nr:hypothetical protein [Clostridia bacterium]